MLSGFSGLMWSATERVESNDVVVARLAIPLENLLATILTIIPPSTDLVRIVALYAGISYLHSSFIYSSSRCFDPTHEIYTHL